MLSVLIEGILTTAPVQRTSAKGGKFVTAQLRANGDDGETVWCSVIAFHATAAEALAQLASGDTVAVAGPAALSQWEKDGQHRVGLKVTVTRVLTVYEAGMRRKAASQAHQGGEARDAGPSAPSGRGQRGARSAPPPHRGRPPGPDDDLPV